MRTIDDEGDADDEQALATRTRPVPIGDSAAGRVAAPAVPPLARR